MYEHHWRLTENPFGEIAGERFFHAAPSHAEGLARLAHLIGQRRNGGCLVGPHGIGKSMLLQLALAHTPDENRRVVRLSAGPGDALSLARRIGERLGASPDADDLPEAMLNIERACHAGLLPATIVIIMDDAQNFRDTAAFDALHFAASTLEACARTPTLILAGTEPLISNLASSSAIAQRMQLTWRLAPLTLSETTSYVSLRLAAAGNRSEVFDQGATYLLYEKSRGIPRIINHLSDLALLHGFHAGAARIDQSLMQRAIAEHSGPAPVISAAMREPHAAPSVTETKPAAEKEAVPVAEEYVWE